MEIDYPPPEKIGVRVLDLEIAAIKLSEIAKIKRLIYDYKLVILSGQNISKSHYLQFARNLSIAGIYTKNYCYLECPKSFNPQSKINELSRCWHSDRAFLQEPLPFTMVRVGDLPQSTKAIYYIDMQRVYQKMPRYLKKYLDGKQCLHEVKYCNNISPQNSNQSISGVCPQIQESFLIAKHPLVIVHPTTGAEILYLSSGFATRIEGMDADTSQEVLQELFAFSEQDEHIQPYILQAEDILLWSNRTLNYMSSRSIDIKPIIRDQIGVSDGLPFYYSSIKRAIQQVQQKHTNA